MDNSYKHSMDSRIVTNYVGMYVVIRTYASGVHCGYLKEYDPETRHAFITDVRRIHYWDGAFTLNAVVTNGIKDGRMPMAIPEIMVSDVLEIIKCTDVASECLRNFPIHTP